MQLISELPGTSKIIAGYAPIKAELDVMPLFALLAAGSYMTALPAAQKDEKELVFYRWRTGETLVKGHHGVSEPSKESPEATPDVVIVPLLAFDRTGHRLGYGSGYYDVTLRSLRRRSASLLAIGAAFSLQEESSLHPDPHDESLDRIVTEKEVINII